MKKRCGLFSVLISIMFIISACGENGAVVKKETRRKSSTGESWTVMIYMCASSLEEKYGRASEVLDSLSSDLPENINVTVETGGADEWHMDGMKSDKIQDFVVQKNGIREIYEMPSRNMAIASTYGDFLKRSMERYPADRYISVIWGDGGGILKGAMSDISFGSDTLTVDEISTALSGIGEKLDIIGFDSSLMSGIEVAQKMSLYADYMVASEGIMPYGGWDYRDLFEYISQNPSASSYDVGKVICDGVMNNASDEEKEQTVMAVTELEGVAKLLQEFDALARHMAEAAANPTILPKLRAEIEKSEHLGANSHFEGYSNIIDLSSLSKSVFNITQSDFARIDNTVSGMVAYKISGKTVSDLCGLSVYYPSGHNIDDINAYKEICSSPGYKKYIDSVILDEGLENREVSIDETESGAFYINALQNSNTSAATDFKGDYILTATEPDIISRAGVNLYKYDAETGRYLHLFTDFDAVFDPIERTYKYEITNKQIELNGVAVDAYPVSFGEKYEIYQIPVIYEGEIVSVRVIKTKDGKKNIYKVLGIWSGLDNDSHLADRRLKNPETGDKLTPIYSIYGGGDEYVKGKSMKIVFGGLNVKEKAISDGDYLVSYTIEDMYGAETESNTTNAVALKGKLKITQ